MEDGKEVIAWARKWFIDGEKPYKVKNANNRMAWPHKFKFKEITVNKIFEDDVPLVKGENYDY